jgi:prolipoprotein diacylglyceryl transferase
MIPAFIPSPSEGVWHLAGFPVRGYALCIILGVVAAVWIGERRWVARGGTRGVVGDVAVWAVPFGLVGGRLYHVLTDPELYFGEGKNPVTALYIWRGGLGIWGAIGLGALGAYIGCRRRGARFGAFADALAPGIAVAQAIGRWGNWFNQELFGKPTDRPWGLEIEPAYRPEGYERYETFHPTFLYECIWNLGVAGLVVWADRRFRLGYGRAFALYVMAYTAGRGWIEYMRIDTVNHIFGVRLNVWTSVVLFLLALAYFVVSARRHPGREPYVETPPDGSEGAAASGAAEPDHEDAPDHADAPDHEDAPDHADEAPPDGDGADADTDSPSPARPET